MTSLAELHRTHSVSASRSDARAQGDSTSPYRPYRPASTSPHIPAGVEASALTWAETVAPGGYTHKIVARGTRVRFDDPTGLACAHVVVYNALETTERLNVADTVKIPWQAYLGENHPLLSGDGRVLATIVTDTSGRHDAFCGTTTDEFATQRYGSAAPQGPAPSGRSLFTLAAAKHGLSPRDLPPSVSFFQGVRVGQDGELVFLGSAGAGAAVELVAELPLLILVANVPHPLDPADGYIVGPLRIHAWRGAPTGEQDERFSSSPELHRAYLNTIDYAEAQAL
jgi:urea carboxylase-associated protein 2